MTVLDLGMPPLRRPGSTAPGSGDRPGHPELIDRFGRVARDLRVSITERCSLRCTYCMPAEGLPRIAQENLLTAAEIARLVGLAARELGVREVRFTGGEPLVRRELLEIVALSRAAAPELPLALTTNGIGLDHLAAPLRDAGLSRVNVSLDTVDRAHFERLTRRDRLPRVLAGIAGAHAAGLGPVKINAVLMRETLEGAADLLAWALEHDTRLRFIEQMPLDADETWIREQMVTAEELLEALGRRFRLDPIGRDDPASPAEEWRVDGGPWTVGIIASVTRSFCAACDRTRLTAEGTVRSCLFGDDETDLRAAMRSGATDPELAQLWRAAMWEKKEAHGIDSGDFVRPVRSMGAIGG